MIVTYNAMYHMNVEAKINIADINDYLINNYGVESQIRKGDYINILTV